MDGDPTPALTGRRRTRPTSIGCRKPWQPKPGRAPLIAAQAAVQTNRATSYHHGIQVGLRWGTLTRTSQSAWRYTDYDKGEEGEIKVILMGFIPFEMIEAIDWAGDEYYGLPIVYCYFDQIRHQPYEKLAFCEPRQLDQTTKYYGEVALYDEVRRLSLKLGIRESF